MGEDGEMVTTVKRALLKAEKLVCVLDVAGLCPKPHAWPISKQHRVCKLVLLSLNVASQPVKMGSFSSPTVRYADVTDLKLT